MNNKIDALIPARFLAVSTVRVNPALIKSKASPYSFAEC